jgi:trehalose 6-phosphate phosphatase
MRHLLESANLEGLEKEVREAPRIFLFLDYDGTLTAIRKSPDLAVLTASARTVLQSLSSLSPRVVLTIVTGRSLVDIERLVGLAGLNYVGNHGLELKAGSFRDEIPQGKRIRQRLLGLCRRVQESARGMPGVLVEWKGLTASIHYRMAGKRDVPALKKAVDTLLASCPRAFELREGKKVLEIRPKTRRNKGWAVKKILRVYGRGRAAGGFPLYFGDDQTDEDAFEAVNASGGCSILVSRRIRASKARWCLGGPGEVRLFLIWLQRRLSAGRAV